MRRTFITILLTVTIAFSILCVHIERTEWNLKEKIYDLNIPIRVDDGKIITIEKQVKKIVNDKNNDVRLSEIKLIKNSSGEYEPLSAGELEFAYYENIGDCGGFYTQERFVVYEVYVNLQKELITHMRVYGDSKVSDFETVETYPEVNEIYDAMYRYCENTKKFENGFRIISSFVNIFNTNNTNTIMSSFTVELIDGTQHQIFGKIVNIKDEYRFTEHSLGTTEQFGDVSLSRTRGGRFNTGGRFRTIWGNHLGTYIFWYLFQTIWSYLGTHIFLVSFS